ncbi:MAG: condensation domain-containing protein [Polyangiaceae bacterium]
MQRNSGSGSGNRSNPASRSYQTAEYLELVGPLDRDVFLQAVSSVLGNTESLNMHYRETAAGVFQEWCAKSNEPTIVDLSMSKDPESRALAWMEREREVAPVLGGALPYASAIIVLGESRHFWYLRVHHIALDGYGYWLVQRAVAKRYRSMLDGTHRSAV